MGLSPDYIVFTDGSVRQNSYAGYGVVLYNCHTKQYATFGGELGHRTISFAESYAIAKALGFLASVMNRRGRPVVLILSDSKYCIQSYGEWMEHWAKRARNEYSDGIWLNKDNGPVQNQVIFKRGRAVISKYSTVNFKFVHINSHLEESSGKDRKRIINKLSDAGLTIDGTTARAIIYMNAKADAIAGQYSRQCMNALRSGDFISLRPTNKYFNGTNRECYSKEELKKPNAFKR